MAWFHLIGEVGEGNASVSFAKFSHSNASVYTNLIFYPVKIFSLTSPTLPSSVCSDLLMGLIGLFHDVEENKHCTLQTHFIQITMSLSTVSRVFCRSAFRFQQINKLRNVRAANKVSLCNTQPFCRTPTCRCKFCSNFLSLALCASLYH